MLHLFWAVLGRYTGCPTTYQTRQFFNNFTTNEDIAQQPGPHYRHIPLHFSPTNVFLFKSRCNIFIGFGTIKELPGLVDSGTPYIWPAQFHHNFPRCLINGNNLGEKNLLNIKCDLILCKSCVCNISHAKKNCAKYLSQVYIGLRVTCPLFLSGFNEHRILSTDFSKNTQNIKFN
jgi:hypothetical protein